MVVGECQFLADQHRAAARLFLGARTQGEGAARIGVDALVGLRRIAVVVIQPVQRLVEPAQFGMLLDQFALFAALAGVQGLVGLDQLPLGVFGAALELAQVRLRRVRRPMRFRRWCSCVAAPHRHCGTSRVARVPGRSSAWSPAAARPAVPPNRRARRRPRPVSAPAAPAAPRRSALDTLTAESAVCSTTRSPCLVISTGTTTPCGRRRTCSRNSPVLMRCSRGASCAERRQGETCSTGQGKAETTDR